MERLRRVAARLRRSPVALLLVLAPLFGEVSCGSSPPLALVNPLAPIGIVALYGGGALLIRELALRARHRLAATLLLGAAYGVLEEGVAVRTFFTDDADFLGAFQGWGEALGTNWLWALEISLYHAVWSIAVPIMLVEAIHPARRDASWLGRRGRAWAAGALLLAVLTFALAASGEAAGAPFAPLATALAGLAALALGVLGMRLRLPALRPRTPASARAVAGAGFALMAVLLLLVIGAPATVAAPWVGVALTVAAGVLAIAWLVRLSGGGTWGDRHRVALVAGAYAVWSLWSLILELAGVIGMSLVGIGGLWLLVRLFRRIAARDAAAPPPCGATALAAGRL